MFAIIINAFGFVSKDTTGWTSCIMQYTYDTCLRDDSSYIDSPFLQLCNVLK